MDENLLMTSRIFRVQQCDCGRNVRVYFDPATKRYNVVALRCPTCGAAATGNSRTGHVTQWTPTQQEIGT